MSEILNKILLGILHHNNYYDIRDVDGVGLCGIQRFLFTTGVCCGLDAYGYRFRFCFETAMYAELFLRDWDGNTMPIVGEDGCTAIK